MYRKKGICLILLLGFVWMIPASAGIAAQTINWEDAAVYLCDSDSIYIQVNALSEYSLSAGGRLSVLVAPKGNEDPKNVLYIDGCDFQTENESYTFSHRFQRSAPLGEYTAKLTYSDGQGLVSVSSHTWRRTNAAETEYERVKGFETIGAGDFAAALESVVSDGFITEDELADIRNIFALGDYFVMAAKGFTSGLFNENLTSFLSMGDVVNCVKAAALIRDLQTGDASAIQSSVRDYAALMPKLFGVNPNYIKFSMIHQPKSYGSAAELALAVRLSAALTLIKDGSYEDVIKALRAYPDVLKVDPSYLSNDAKLTAIAKALRTDGIDAYRDGLADELYAIANKITTGETGGNSGGRSAPQGIPKAVDLNLQASDKASTNGSHLEFSDLENSPWARADIMHLCEMGIINGVGQNLFEPDRTVTREEFVKMIVSAFSIPNGQRAMRAFDDCPVDAWYYPYVETAYTNSLINGTGSGFGTGRAVTRQDAAVIAFRAIRYLGKEGAAPAAGTFSDARQIQEYAADAIDYLSGESIISGFPDGSFRPEAHTTRAQAAVIVRRLMKKTQE